MKWRCIESGHWMAEADGWEWHAWAIGPDGWQVDGWRAGKWQTMLSTTTLAKCRTFAAEVTA
jgi:hypothetical protein